MEGMSLNRSKGHRSLCGPLCRFRGLDRKDDEAQQVVFR